MKKILTLLTGLLLSLPVFAQGNFTSPFLTAGSGLTLNYTSGTIINGGEIQAITGATLTMSDTQTSCAAPTFSSCNFVYWHTGTSLSTTTTLSTATASGNIIIGYVKTTGGAITQVIHANTTIPYPNGIGQTAAFTSAPVPQSAAGTAVGSNALPFSSIFLGTAATNNQNILPAATGAARTIGLCDQGANGAVCFSDQATPSKQFLFDAHSATASTVLTVAHTLAASRSWNIVDQGANGAIAFGDQTDPTKSWLFDSHSATTAKTLTLAHALGNSRTVTFPDGGGNTNVAYANNNASTVQVMSTINSNTGNKALLTSDFTDSNTAGLQAITGLSFTLPTSFTGNLAFHCSLLYSQATAVASDQFGVAVTTTAPTRVDAVATVATNTTAVAVANLQNLTTTTPTAIITFTDAANGTIFPAYLDGVAQLAGGGSQVLQFYVANGTAANLIIVRAGSYCTIN